MKNLNRTIHTGRLFNVICFSTLLTLPFSTRAQSADADFSPLQKARNTAAVEALARERLAKNSKDDVAIWFWARTSANDAKKREEITARAEQCIKDLPQSARCHSALGALYGTLAMSGGMTAGLKYAGKIKDMMLKAVELEPKNYDMRRDLNQYYLQAPGIVGGSVKKAIENSNDFGKIDAPRGQLLRAEIHIYEKEFAKADELLRAIKTSGDADLNDAVIGAMTNLGYVMLSNGEAAKAQKIFEQQIAVNDKSATAHFGLGRVMLELKNIDAAITSMERAMQIDPKLLGHYRLGLAYVAKGDKPKAIAALQQFLSYQKTGKAAEDATKKLEELKRG